MKSKPYTYKIVCIVTGQIYFGSRYSSKYLNSGRTPEEDLLVCYRGSSQYLDDLYLIHGIDKFTFEVIDILETVEETYAAECKLIDGVWNSPQKHLSLNYCRGGKKFRPNVTDEFRNNISKFREDTFIITDGHRNMFVKNASDIPEGWAIGSTGKPKGRSYWVTDGVNNLRVLVGLPVPDGYTKGRTMPKARWHTNGIDNSFAVESPDGFYLGYTNKSNHGLHVKGSVWINDGKINKRIGNQDTVPYGFVKGRIIPQALGV